MGSPEEAYEKGLQYLYGDSVEKNLEEALKWLLDAAENGHAAAQYNLGVCYMRGMGTECDQAQGFQWFLKAALQNHVKAWHSLGVCYKRGMGTEKDDQSSFEAHLVAAEMGCTQSQYEVGSEYLSLSTKKIIPSNDFEAVKWFMRAAEKNHPEAISSLGDCYRLGLGVPKNEQKAVECYRKSSELNVVALSNNEA